MVDTFKPDKGYTIKRRIVTHDDDGDIIAVDLTGKTLVLEYKDSTGVAHTITGSSSAPLLGYAEFVVPASFFQDAMAVEVQYHISQGSDYLQHTEYDIIDVGEIVGST